MVNIGDENPYEQYGAMPSVEFPSVIKDCKDNINFTICNKNLFIDDFRKYSRTTDYFCCPLKLKKWEEYRFYGELLKDKLDNFVIGIVKDGDNYTNFLELKVVLKATGDIKELNFVVDETYTNPQLVVFAGTYNFEANFNSIFENYRFQLEESNVRTDYVEHKEQNFTFPLKQKLYKTDFLAEDGIHHARKEIELDGTENWAVINDNIFYITLNDMKFIANAMSSHFAYTRKVLTDLSNGEFTTIAGQGYSIWIKKEEMTLEEFRAYLAQQKANGTPVVINYELAEEELEEYSAEQKAIYDEIMQAKSYKEKTHIFSADEIGPKFDVEWIKDTSIILNNLSKSIVGGN